MGSVLMLLTIACFGLNLQILIKRILRMYCIYKKLMNNLGVKKHYVTKDGIHKIEL